MPNHLINENSLYLKQHANNPVDWWPWCPEAFKQAKKLNKPVLVSIGYSACHWCHVMANESFSDPFIADLMNRHFICIKVDREEHPDVDQIYMEAVQMITGRGGWPLNAFCFPDGRPFFAGTYFPPEDRGHGIIPWPQLLLRIADFFKKNPHELEENATNILKNITISNTPIDPETQTALLTKEIFFSSAEKICQTHDDTWGGFGSAPKFPPTMILDFLLATKQLPGCPKALIQGIQKSTTTTLTKMAFGGIYDQLGGGFFRYSVDAQWKIPHFEKMLYDNALLILLYTKAWTHTRAPLFKEIVYETIDWLFREMSVANTPAFASSLSAESQGKEGKYYVWTFEEIKNILGEERMNAFCSAFSVTPEGNFEKGFNHLNWIKETAEDRHSFATDRQKLLAARLQRKPPERDDKILTTWNSLLAQALAQAGFYFKKDEWILHARKLIDWIWQHLSNQKDSLQSVYYPELGKGTIDGFLDDYAFYAHACLTLASKIEVLEKNASSIYIERAESILKSITNKFKDSDPHHPGFFFTSSGTDLVARKKVWLDNALPCGNATLLHVLSELYGVTGNSAYIKDFQAIQEGYKTLIHHIPNAVAYALLGSTGQNAAGITVIKFGSEAPLEPLAHHIRTHPYHPIYCLPNAKLGNRYQTCIGTHCLSPTVHPEDALKFKTNS